MLSDLYIDGLSKRLASSRIGCLIGGEYVNHITYVDDMVLLASSMKALQTVFDFSFEFANENDIQYYTGCGRNSVLSFN